MYVFIVITYWEKFTDTSVLTKNKSSVSLMIFLVNFKGRWLWVREKLKHLKISSHFLGKAWLIKKERIFEILAIWQETIRHKIILKYGLPTAQVF